MLKNVMFLFAIIAASQLLLPVTSFKVLILGDSMAQFSGQSLATYCSGATVFNGGIGGTTADEWGSTMPHLLDAVGGANCGSTLSNSAGDKIWLSIGGNDVMGSKGCAMTSETLTPKVASALSKVSEKAPGVPIVMTGYPQLNQPEEGSVCDLKFVPRINAGVKKACEAHNTGGNSCTYIDSLLWMEGNTTAFSCRGYFRDGIHLNGRGYCQFWSNLQDALGCTPAATPTCSSASCTTEGLDTGNCVGADPVGCTGCDTWCSDTKCTRYNVKNVKAAHATATISILSVLAVLSSIAMVL